MTTNGSFKIDLHMHSTVSDGTDTPAQIYEKVAAKGIAIFSLSDHDAVKGSVELTRMVTGGGIRFITGAEFSCRDSEGKYHILAYHYDPESEAINRIVERGHAIRMSKVVKRIELLKQEFGYVFSPEDIEALMSLDNPGKPHIANMMVKYGYAENKEQAIRDYIDKLKYKKEYLAPEEAIRGILDAGGIPVLAHGPYGSGDELIIGDELKERIKRLVGFGLQGLEGFYSGYTHKLRDQVLAIARDHDLYVTAGSDYHGRNKLVELGDTGLESPDEMPEGMSRFLAECLQ